MQWHTKNIYLEKFGLVAFWAYKYAYSELVLSKTETDFTA